MYDLVIILAASLLLWIINNHLAVPAKPKRLINLLAAVLILVWIATMVIQRLQGPSYPEPPPRAPG